MGHECADFRDRRAGRARCIQRAGLVAGRWLVASSPCNPTALTSYRAVAARNDARLGIVASTIQYDAKPYRRA